MRFICKKNRDESQKFLKKLTKEEFKKLCDTLINVGASDDIVTFKLENYINNIYSLSVIDKDERLFKFDVNFNNGKLPSKINVIDKNIINIYEIFDDEINILSHGYIGDNFSCTLFSDNRYLNVNNGDYEYNVDFRTSSKPLLEALLLDIYTNRDDIDFDLFYNLCTSYIDMKKCNNISFITNYKGEMISNIEFVKGRLNRYDVTKNLPNGTRRTCINRNNVTVYTNTVDKYKVDEYPEMEKIKKRFL